MKLKDTMIRNVKPSTKTTKLFDGGGLYLQVSPKGQKGWRLKYYFDGKEKCLSLGVYPVVSLKDARERRDEMKRLLANGVNPSEHRKLAKGSRESQLANSFENIAREWILKQQLRWTVGHQKRIKQRLENDIFPWLGQICITDISPSQLLAALRRIEDRGAIDSAHRILNHCSQIFRYAIATNRAERNIASDLQGALSPVKKGHFAAVIEPDQVGELLRAFENYHGSFIVACALKLAPLVFVRPGELRQAKWADIDLNKAEWRYLVTKTDMEHIVPLSTQAMSILKALHPLTGHASYIFPSARTHTRPMSDNAILAAMRRLGIPKEQMTGHGFRAMARTLLDEVLGMRPDVIEHQLAHAVRDPNGRAYNRTTFLAERKNMMQKWADYLDELKKQPIDKKNNCISV